MARLPAVTRAELAPADQRYYDEIEATRGGVRGPFSMLLHSPDLAARIAHVGTYVRFETTLGPATRELAILTVARAWSCQYEWAAHHPIATAAGTRSEAIDAVRQRTAPAGMTPTETAVHTYVHELVTVGRVSQAAFDAALELLGRQGLTDLTATAGYYSLLACTLNAFDVQPDAGPPLPP